MNQLELDGRRVHVERRGEFVRACVRVGPFLEVCIELRIGADARAILDHLRETVARQLRERRCDAT